MANVAELQIKVSATGVQPFAKSLESLGKAAQSYRADIKKVHTTLSEMGNVKLPTLGKGISQFKSLASATSGIKGATTSFTKLADAVDRMVSQTSGLSEVAKQLRSIKNSVTAMSGVRLNIGGATGSGTSGSRGGMSDQDKLMKQITREGQMASVGYDKAAYLEQRAAMLGVSEAAKPYIAQMRAANKVVGVGVTNTRAYANAMRLVPAQLTDVVTQLAGGQNPLLIMIQQGGQLADVFRMAGVSMGGMLKAVGGAALSALLNPLTALVALVGVVAYKVYSLESTTANFAKALAITGNVTGTTSKALTDMAYSAASAEVTVGEGAAAVTELASQGIVANGNYSTLANTVSRFSNVFGVDLNKAVAEYISLSEKASEKVLDLNKKYNFLTPAVYAQIVALEKEGKQVEANALTNEKLAEAQDKMVKESKANMGILASAWDTVKNSVTGAASAVWNFRLAQNEGDRLVKINSRIAELEESKVKWQKSGSKQREMQLDQINQELTDAYRLQASLNGIVNKKNEEFNANQKKAQQTKEELQVLEWIGKHTDKTLSKEQVLVNFQKQKATWIAANGEAAAKNVNWTELEKKYLEEQFPISTKLTKDSDKRAQTEAERQQRQAGIVASLKEQLKDGEARLADLRGEDTEYTKINEHISKAASLRAQADKEKNAAVKTDLLIQADLEQKIGDQLQLIWKINQAEKDRKELADQTNSAAEIRKRYAETETDQLKEQEAQDLKKIDNLTKMSQAERDQLKTIVEQGTERKKAEAFVSGSGNAILQEEERHRKRLQWISENKVELQKLNMYDMTAKQENFLAEQNMFNARKQMFAQQRMWQQTLMSSIDAAASSLSSSISGMIKGTSTLKDLFTSLGNTLLDTVVGALVEYGKQMLVNTMLDKAFTAQKVALIGTETAASVTATTAQATATTAANTEMLATAVPLAAAESTISFGTAAAIGIGALLAGFAMAKSNMMMDNGGTLQPGQSAVVGEYGREIITAGSSPVRVTSRKETERMMGQSGGSGGAQVNMKVINNAGVDVQQTTDTEGNILLVLEKYVPDMLAREGSNPKSKLNQAQSSIYAQKRR